VHLAGAGGCVLEVALMPIYEYRCRECGSRFEALVRRGDNTVVQCPSCESRDLEQQISLFAVSSEATRQASFSVAKQKNAKVLRDKATAEEEAIRNHDH
jgi:putative FmdB family regulatory protein